MAIRRKFIAGLAIAAAALAQPAHAAGWPAKPITIINPYPVGGAVDIVAREVGMRLSAVLGQEVIVDTRSGAGGTIGAAKLAHSAPDGYTLMVHNQALPISAALYGALPYDTGRDILPIAYLGATPNLLVVNNDVPAKTVAELLALAKEKPGKINYGSAGAGSSSHIAMAMFVSMTGAKMEHIPYKGSGPAMVGLVGGQTQVMLQTAPAAMSFIQSGRLRALATSGKNRSPALPDVPTIAESGVKGFEFYPWFGLFAPAGTAPEVADKLHDAVNQVLKDPELVDKLGRQSLEVDTMSRQAFADLYQKDIATWGKTLDQLGIKIETSR